MATCTCDLKGTSTIDRARKGLPGPSVRALRSSDNSRHACCILQPNIVGTRAERRQIVSQTRYSEETRLLRRDYRPQKNEKASAAAEVSSCREPLLSGGLSSTPACLFHTPWKILIPHSTMTMANTSVAAVSTLSKEATLILTLRFPAPSNGLGDSLIRLQSRQTCAGDVARRLCFTGHTSGMAVHLVGRDSANHSHRDTRSSRGFLPDSAIPPARGADRNRPAPACSASVRQALPADRILPPP